MFNYFCILCQHKEPDHHFHLKADACVCFFSFVKLQSCMFGLPTGGCENDHNT